MLVETKELLTVHNFAKKYNGKGCTVQYIYRLIDSKKINCIEIDGQKFCYKKEISAASKPA